MTKQECRERNCPFFDEEMDDCAVLKTGGYAIEEVDNCVGIRITEEASDNNDDDYSYETQSEMRDYCERYEPTYNPEDGSM